MSDIRTPGIRWRARYTADGAHIERVGKGHFETVFADGRRVTMTGIGDASVRTFELLGDWIRQGVSE